MRRNLFQIFLFLLFLLTPFLYTYAENNSGLLDNTIWYSKDNFVEGDTVEIHTAVWNGEVSTLEAKVDFMDASTIIGTRSISVAPHTLADVFISWKVTAGDHTIKTIIRDTNLKVNGKSTPIKFTYTEQSLSKISISKKISKELDAGNNLADNVSEKVKENLPTQIAEPVARSITSVDDFRANTATTVSTMLASINQKIEELNNQEKAPAEPNTKDPKKAETVQKPLSGTEKPIAYVELFLLTIVSFIFKNSIVFYLLCAFILFIILRFIYRKIRR